MEEPLDLFKSRITPRIDAAAPSTIVYRVPVTDQAYLVAGLRKHHEVKIFEPLGDGTVYLRKITLTIPRVPYVDHIAPKGNDLILLVHTRNHIPSKESLGCIRGFMQQYFDTFYERREKSSRQLMSWATPHRLE